MALACSINAVYLLSENENNNTQLHLNPSGTSNVGIGLNNASYSLDVNGDINASANVRAAGTILTSDARLKTDVVEVEDALAIVEKLRPVQYSKKQNLISQDYNKEEFGFIAQEVRKLLPSLVSEGLDEDKLLSMDYNFLISILTKAIQEQQLQMDSYKAENEELKNRISKIEKALRIELGLCYFLSSGNCKMAAVSLLAPKVLRWCLS